MGDHLEAKFAAVSARSRRLLVDAAVCFVATSCIALLPPEWKNGEALKEIVFTTDPVSGKIIDRIEFAQAEPAAVESQPAAPRLALFAVYPPERIADWSQRFVDRSNEAVAEKTEKTETSVVKPTKTVALHKPNPDKRNPVESTPPASPTDNAEPPAPPQPMGEVAEPQERGLLAKLDPTGLSSKLAPLGRKAWDGATSIGGAVSSLVSAYHF
ncbi:MAG: hypothetical protein AB7F41_01090 [Methylocystis sp.]|uniref:hypothetical protein n=1 Tax=Methylocystis sp. TaxID=1911079 RepID=UPI003D0C3722